MRCHELASLIITRIWVFCFHSLKRLVITPEIDTHAHTHAQHMYMKVRNFIFRRHLAFSFSLSTLVRYILYVVDNTKCVCIDKIADGLGRIYFDNPNVIHVRESHSTFGKYQASWNSIVWSLQAISSNKLIFPLIVTS